MGLMPLGGTEGIVVEEVGPNSCKDNRTREVVLASGNDARPRPHKPWAGSVLSTVLRKYARPGKEVGGSGSNLYSDALPRPHVP